MERTVVAAKGSCETVTLRYWSETVSINGQLFEVNIDLNELELVNSKLTANRRQGISGIYAKYPEGIFAVLFCKNNWFLMWRGRLIELQNISEVSWSSTILGRNFIVKNRDGHIALKVNYKTVLCGLINPIRMFVDIVDDDWGLDSDLPSYIESCMRVDKCLDRIEGFITNSEK